MRVRQFTQDDAHIFCTHEQLVEETVAFCALLDTVYRDPRLPRLSGEAGDSTGAARRHRRRAGTVPRETSRRRSRRPAFHTKCCPGKAPSTGRSSNFT
jgi:hypothetical protein